MTQQALPILFDDNPEIEDLLGFDAIVAPVIAALSHPRLDPITIGIHAPWGGGKSTVLNLIEAAKPDGWLIVRTTPWEYEDQLDVKGTLIAQVLSVLEPEAEKVAGLQGRVRNLLERISWSRVGIAVAKGALTMQWNAEELVKAFMPEAKDGPQSLVAFKGEFEDLVAGIPDVKRVVVLVDDLDRCLPDAVLATLEAIKLFLSVKKMAFVIAADQDMVRDAISASLAGTNRGDAFADRYLEKIVQLPVAMPRLSQEESGAYIAVLLTAAATGVEEVRPLVKAIGDRRRAGTALLADFGDLTIKPDESDLALATQLNDGMAAEKRGNPREIKRRLNAFTVRRQVMEARGVDARPAVVMKLLLLEDRYQTAFETLVGKPSEERGPLLAAWEAWGRGEQDGTPEGVPDQMRGWAGAEPMLADLDLDAYLTLAGTLSSASVGSGMSDVMRKIVRDIMSDSDVLAEEAEEAIAKATDEDRHRLGRAFLEEARRTSAEAAPRVVRGLVAVAQGSPGLANELAQGMRSRMWGNLTAAVGVGLATSGVPAYVELARSALTAAGVSAMSKESIRLALEAK